MAIFESRPPKETRKKQEKNNTHTHRDLDPTKKNHHFIFPLLRIRPLMMSTIPTQKTRGSSSSPPSVGQKKTAMASPFFLMPNPQAREANRQAYLQLGGSLFWCKKRAESPKKVSSSVRKKGYIGYIYNNSIYRGSKNKTVRNPLNFWPFLGVISYNSI